MSETQGQRGGSMRKQAVRNAGPSYRVGGENLGILAPLHTLDDDYRDEPAEPEDSDRVPEPEAPGRIRHLLERLTRPRDP